MNNRALTLTLLSIAIGCYDARSALKTTKVTEYAPIVKTEAGSVRGVVEVAAQSGLRVYLYQGIKFGQALRFRKPVKSSSWNETYNATTYRYACPQPNMKSANHIFTDEPSNLHKTLYSNEDCLFLNVFRPEKETTEKRSVLVWVHGGTFWSGTIFGKEFDAKYIASIGDVVVVTVNYRLGAFGFLLGDDAEHPGNLGLYDQILALKWVQENIEHFGGDPKNVTIFGESAGSMSVGALVLSPLTKDLFHRAILQSGAPNSFIGSESKEKAWKKVKFLGSFLNCNQNNTAGLVKCIETKPTEEIQNVVNTIGKIGQFFEPSYGTELLPHSPVELLKTGQFNSKIDLLYGVNRDEGANGVYNIFPAIRPDSGKTITVDMVRDAIKQMVEVFGVTVLGGSEEIADWYSKGLNESDQVAMRNAVANVYGDFNLVCPTMFFGQQFAKIAPSNRYFSYRLVQSVSGGSGGCEKFMGVCHSVDNEFIWGHTIDGYSTGRYTHRDCQLSLDIIHAWTSFARTGSPRKMGNVRWEEAFGNDNHGLVSHSMMLLDVDHYQIVTGFFKNVCDGFWRSRIF